MTTPRSTLVAITTFACTAAFVLAGCGGGSSNSVAKFCRDNETLSARYASLGDTVAFDPSGLTKVKQLAADLSRLGNEAPAAIKPDVQQLADGMAKVASGQGNSVDEDAIRAVGNRIDDYANAKCNGADASERGGVGVHSRVDADDGRHRRRHDGRHDAERRHHGAAVDHHARSPQHDGRATPKRSSPARASRTILVIVEQKDATVAAGLVIEQDPYAGSRVTGEETVTLTVSAVPDQAFLSDFRATDGSFRPGVASMKGVPYTHGVLQSQGAGYNPQKTTFTLSGHYVRLKGVVGLDDEFTGGASVQVEIFDQDNTSLLKKIVKVGQPVTIDIPVTNVIQLTLEATDLLSNVANSGTVVWGDVQVVSGS